MWCGQARIFAFNWRKRHCSLCPLWPGSCPRYHISVCKIGSTTSHISPKPPTRCRTEVPSFQCAAVKQGHLWNALPQHMEAASDEGFGRFGRSGRFWIVLEGFLEGLQGFGGFSYWTLAFLGVPAWIFDLIQEPLNQHPYQTLTTQWLRHFKSTPLPLSLQVQLQKLSSMAYRCHRKNAKLLEPRKGHPMSMGTGLSLKVIPQGLFQK